MPIASPQIILWANQRARTIADEFELFYAKVASHVNDFQVQDIIDQIIAAGASQTVDDGSNSDGRSIITGQNLIDLYVALSTVLTTMNTANTGVYGNPTNKTVVDRVQVMGTIR
jgi:hypothetical protein